MSVTLADEQPKEPVHIGKMTAFWRNRPVLGQWLKGGLGLEEVPGYLCDPSLSFPYRKRPYPKEVLFADHLTVVRLLGGWQYEKGKGELDGGPEADLAYRGEDGTIRYRWELIGPRLDHYVENGYDLTIVLDNTPWCFPAKPVSGSHFGQSAPAADFKEWGAFIEELCRQLVKRYGMERVNGWRFRMGTECQGEARFTGPQEDFFKLYDHAAAAVRCVLPGAKFGPFNLAGGPDEGNVRYYALADHCMTGRNHATGEMGSPMDFAAVSIYMAPVVSKGILRTTNPDYKARTKVDFWTGLAARHSRLKDIPREVHEFGILGNEFKAGGGEPGARGAAWEFHIMMNLREGGMERLWQWGVMEDVRTGKGHKLLVGSGWLLSVLEQTVGGETYILSPRVEPADADMQESECVKEIASYQRPEKLAQPGEMFYKSIAVVQERRAFLITSAYHEDRFVTRAAKVTVSVPKTLLAMDAAAKVRHVALTRTNSVHFRLRQDLAAAGLLAEEFQKVPGLLSSVRDMAGREGWSYVDRNWATYQTIIKDSLTLKPFAGEVRSDATHHHFTFALAPPSVMVIVVEKDEHIGK
ncbi:MAG: hypothetical protein AB1696_29095 [Planctomycetota bacterium]